MFTSADVMDLRKKTGAGIADCKKALTETDGDMEKAIDFLREKGIATAAKKASRIAAEGIVAAKVAGNKGVLVEVNCETDFVAKGDQYKAFVDGVADGVAREPERAQRVHRAAVALGDDAEEQMLGGDVGLAMGHGLAVGALEHALGAGREGDVAAGDGLGLLGGQLLDGVERLLVGDIELGERLGGDALPLLDEGEQQVPGAHVHLAEVARLVLRDAHHLAGLVGELLELTLPVYL